MDLDGKTANFSPRARAILMPWHSVPTASFFGFDSDMEWDWGTVHGIGQYG